VPAKRRALQLMSEYRMTDIFLDRSSLLVPEDVHWLVTAPGKMACDHFLEIAGHLFAPWPELPRGVSCDIVTGFQSWSEPAKFSELIKLLDPCSGRDFGWNPAILIPPSKHASSLLENKVEKPASVGPDYSIAASLVPAIGYIGLHEYHAGVWVLLLSPDSNDFSDHREAYFGPTDYIIKPQVEYASDGVVLRYAQNA